MAMILYYYTPLRYKYDVCKDDKSKEIISILPHVGGFLCILLMIPVFLFKKLSHIKWYILFLITLSLISLSILIYAETSNFYKSCSVFDFAIFLAGFVVVYLVTVSFIVYHEAKKGLNKDYGYLVRGLADPIVQGRPKMVRLKKKVGKEEEEWTEDATLISV